MFRLTSMRFYKQKLSALLLIITGQQCRYGASNRLLIALLCATACAKAPSAHAEKVRTAKEGDRPRVGLVLAGGGALGFAHVGVLRVLERNRIPVDVVTGTSMGAIVGGAYAAGVDLQTMEGILADTDWDALFSEGIPRSFLPFRSKPGRNRELFGDAKIAIKEGSIVTPTGIVTGQNVLPLLQRLYGNVPSPVDFNALPLPFRAVTADIETGQPVIPGGGDLSTIVRASMSVPGVFTPVEMDGKLLVDGGIVNNLPIDIAKQLGATRLIVVELNADFSRRDKLTSPLAISGQIVSLLLSQNSAIQKQSLSTNDVLIEPPLTGYSAADFGKGKEIMALGEATAEKLVSSLSSFVVSESEYAAYKQRRMRQIPAEGPVITAIKVDNSSPIADEAILAELKIKPGDRFSLDDIESAVQRVYHMGAFEEVKYGFIDTSAGREVTVTTERKPWSDKFFRLGASLQDDFDGNESYRLGIEYRNTTLSTPGSYASVQAEIGLTPSLIGEFYQPFAKGSPYFVAPTVGLTRTNILLRSNDEVIAQYFRDVIQGGVAVGRQLGSVGEMRVTGRRGSGDLNRNLGDPTLQELSYEIGEVSSTIDIDTLDNPDLPSKGTLLRVSELSSLPDLGASDEFHQVVSSAVLPFTFNDTTTISLRGEVGNTWLNRPVERSFTFGGFLDVSGFAQNSLIASDYATGRLMIYDRFSTFRAPLLGLDIFGGMSLEHSSLRSDLPAVNDLTSLTSGSVFVGADTPILPVYLGFGMAEGGVNSIYLAIGRFNVRER